MSVTQPLVDDPRRGRTSPRRLATGRGSRVKVALILIAGLTGLPGRAFAQADLAVTKTVSNPQPVEGEEIVYTVTVTNGGPADALMVTVDDELPAGVTFAQVDSIDQGSYDEVAGVWTVGALLNGASAELEIRASVDAGTAETTGTGDFIDVFASPIVGPDGVAFGPDGSLYVSSRDNSRVERYDAETGAFIDVFATGGGLDNAQGITFGPDGNLYVASSVTDSVVYFDGETGAPLGVFAQGGGLDFPEALVFGPDGQLYVSGRLTGAVVRYDGASGAFIDVFTSGGLLNEPDALTFGPDGNLYVVSDMTGEVLRFDGTTGAYIDSFTSGGAVQVGRGLRFGPDGHLYLASHGSDEILRYDGATGEFIDVFAVGSGTGNPEGITFGPDGNLYVATGVTNAVLRYEGFIVNNAAAADALEPDPDALDEAASAGIDVVQPADLSATLAVSNDNPVETEELVYTLIASNAGPLDAPGTTVDFPLPAEVTFVQVDLIDQGSYDDLGGVWDVGMLASGAEAQLEVRVSVSVGTVEGTYLGPFAEGPEIDGNQAAGAVFGPDGNLYLVARSSRQVLRYDGTTGDFIDIFVGTNLNNPEGLTFGPGGDLYVTTAQGGGQTNSVQRFDGLTGAFLGTFIDSTHIDSPTGLTFGADGNLYVASSGTDEIVKFDGTTGAFLGVFAQQNLNIPRDLVFGPDGHLYVTHSGSGQDPTSVERFDGATGAPLGSFAVDGLSSPTGLAFGFDGNLYVADDAVDAVLRFDGLTGALLQVFVDDNTLRDPQDVIFGPDGSLYVSHRSCGGCEPEGVVRYRSSIVARATIDGLVDDPDPANDEASGWFNVLEPAADLVVSAAVSEDRPVETQEIVFTTTVTNMGPTTANGVVVNDMLPAGVTFVQVDLIEQGTYDEGLGVWDVGLMPDGATVSLELRATVDPGTSETTGTGEFLGIFATVGGPPAGLTFDLQGNLYVADFGSSQVLQFAPDGTPLGNFVNGGGLSSPWDVRFGPDGDLYVSAQTLNEVLRYDGTTGDYLGVFTQGGTMTSPRGLTFGPNGDLFVANSGGNQILRYDRDGEYLGVFASGNGLDQPRGITFGPDGNLYVASTVSDQVLRFDGTDGTFIDDFAVGGSMNDPFYLAFGPDGNLYVASRLTDEVLRYNGFTGAFIDVFATGGGLSQPGAVAFGPDGNLYVNSAGNDAVLRYQGFIANVAVATAAEPDPNQFDNRDSVGLVVGPPAADLAVTATVDDGTPQETQEVVYTVTVSNTGPLATTGVTVADELPVGVTFVGIDAIDQGSYDEGTGVWDVGALGVGASAALAIRASVNPGTAETTGTGALITTLSDPLLSSPRAIDFDPEGLLYVTSGSINADIVRFDPVSGMAEVFADDGTISPLGLTIGPDGDLYVTDDSGLQGRVVRFDGTTGALVGDFVPDTAALNDPRHLAFGPDGLLYVANVAGDQVVRFDAATGAYVDVLTSPDLDAPEDVAFDASGRIYVSSFNTDQVLRFDSDGSSPVVFASGPEINGAYGLRFGPDGDLYVVGNNADQIARYTADGTLIGVFATEGITYGRGCAFGPDGTLYLADGTSDQVLGYQGFITNTATASSDLIDPDILDNTDSVGIEVSLATGACCFADGTCTPDQLDDDCTGAGGAWQGQGTDCMSGLCGGACCFADGTCAPDTTLLDCNGAGGAWQGQMTTCMAATCPQPGACCRLDGMCVQADALGGAACIAAGGMYQGDDTLCGDVTCPDGACCLEGGSCSQVQTEALCVVAGGLWQDAGTECMSVSCPLSACCFGMGACGEFELQSTCEALGGVWQGFGVSCAMASCPQPGACCLLDGTCQQDSDVFGSDCAAAGGLYQGPDTLCVSTDCPDGACCYDDGTCTDQPTQTDCQSGGGVWHDAGTSCATFDCPDGACCFVDGTCADVPTQTDCETTMGGTWQTAGTMCATFDCPDGACCLPDGSCTVLQTQDDCQGMTGTWQGAGTDCGAGDCPVGACCLPSNLCDDVSPTQCATMSGLYQGDGSACAAGTCPPSGQVWSYVKISATSGGFGGALAPGDGFGSSLASLRDFNNDGVADLIAGAPLDDDGGMDRGAAWLLILNADGTVTTQYKISSTAGSFAGTLDDADHFGSAVASIGDLDGDGVVDVAVGATGDDDGGAPGSERGAVWILFLDADGTVKTHQKISATEGGLSPGPADTAEFGKSIASLGDLDGDGVRDIAVGAWRADGTGTDVGEVWILFLNADGTVKAQQKIDESEGGFTGSLDDLDVFGSAVRSLGDLNGDGRADLAVSAQGDGDGGSDVGAVWILFLNANGTVASQQKISATEGGFTGQLDGGDHFGASLAALADLDGDGVIDLAVGAPGDDDVGGGGDGPTDRGAVWVLFLNPDGTVKAHQKLSAADGNFTGVLDPGDFFGRAVASLADLDGNGVRELVVGAPGDDDGGPGPSGDRGAAWVLFLAGVPGPIEFELPVSAPCQGSPLIHTVGDFDTPLSSGGFVDVAVVIPDASPALPGSVQIFLNQGNMDSDWQGLEPQLALIEVGADPRGITVGDFDGDDWLDLAVTNRGDDTVTILMNNADGSGTFVAGPVVAGFDGPSGIAAADFVGIDGAVDLAVTNESGNDVIVLENIGGVDVFQPLMPAVPVGQGPVSIDPADIDEPKDTDFVAANHQADTVSVVLNGGDGTFIEFAVIGVGADPVDLAIGDIDGVNGADIVSANNGDGTISVILQGIAGGSGGGADGPGPVFDPPVPILVGLSPQSVEAVDLDLDGDLDLVVVGTDDEVGPALLILENLLLGPGAAAGSGGVQFGVPQPITIDADPEFVLSGDFNQDAVSDLVTVNVDMDSVTVLINATSCPGDVTRDGNTDFADLLALLGAWGMCETGVDCPADFDGDTIVAFSDLLMLLGNWGPCE